MNNWKMGFDIGVAFTWFELHIKDREEILIHQSCNKVLELLDRINRDTHDIEKSLKQTNDVIEYNKGNIEDANFWLFIIDEKDKLKRVLKGMFS